MISTLVTPPGIIALRMRGPTVAKLLLRAGSDPQIKNKAGETPGIFPAQSCEESCYVHCRIRPRMKADRWICTDHDDCAPAETLNPLVRYWLDFDSSLARDFDNTERLRDQKKKASHIYPSDDELMFMALVRKS